MSEDKVGAGKGVLNRHEQLFKRGSLMFIEGESSAEMFIIRSGKIRILKQEGEGVVELAVLGPGSVIGELALLDHQPRSATAQVVEDTLVTVIDEDLFTRTIEKIPSWLASLIQLVVKRLRDTMKRTSDDIVNKSIAGVAKVIQLLYETKSISLNGEKVIPLNVLKQTVFAVIGLSGMDVENILVHLIFKDMLLVRKSETGQEYVFVKNDEILRLYINYLRTHSRGGSIVGEQFDGPVFELIAAILSAGKKNGRKDLNQIIRIGMQQVEIELERNGKDRFMNLDALDNLINAKLLLKQEDATSTDFGKHKRAILIYNEDALRKVFLLQQWLTVFREEIRF
ncbi:MAG TPA: cyclic nucleotide-binding domain-containing protein [Chitinispirillaceae bacterium]|nr:cyclic nucleotide-binding domain-containing protein [Chitinispirillaceae bacterium]